MGQTYGRRIPSPSDGVKKSFSKLLGFVLLIVIALVVVFGSIYTVESGQEGVLLTFGKADMIAKDPGLHFKVPIVQRIVKFDVKTAKFEASVTAASKDLQDVSTTVALNYHLLIGDTPRVFSEMGSHFEVRVIQPAVQEVVKAVTARYTAEELIKKRPDVKKDIEEALSSRIDPRGIKMETLAITDFTFSESFTHAIEAKVVAEQRKQQADRDLLRIEVEAEQIAATARGNRDARIAHAEGQAKEIRLLGDAEAQRIDKVQSALEKSPEYIDWVKADSWDGQLPTFYGGGMQPFMDVTKVLG